MAASRGTRQEAEKVKARMEERHPGVTIRIVERGPRFVIMEARKCQCGTEVLTAAIGELGANECPACREKRQARHKAEGRAQVEKARQSVASWVARDVWEEA